mmetsp:Transcript_127690/g.408273  ORF Transcript_127690/g.408273 Transcript_127690/m.408273 type:complete len:81 (-) Transcript_127690:181-423(-)
MGRLWRRLPLGLWTYGEWLVALMDLNSSSLRKSVVGHEASKVGWNTGVTCCTRCPPHAWCSPQTLQCYMGNVKTYTFPCP